MINRRQFFKGAGTLAFAGLASSALGKANAGVLTPTTKGYGPLVPDPKKLLDLPQGFSYQVISELGDAMSDGLNVPDRADGMGCFSLGNNKVALVRNHELQAAHLSIQPESIQTHTTELAYDHFENGVALPGGTTTLVYNLDTKVVEKEFVSLVGTIRNCSGGITPWGTWLTCEESVNKPNGVISKEHGYIFEVPADAETLVQAKPLKAMGRFNHEAACVDPETGIVYLTEDRGDSLFYRFIPNVKGQLDKGGKLQALRIKGVPQFDSRNWDKARMNLGEWLNVDWIDLHTPESPNDDLRVQGYKAGATLFARGEGLHWGNNELYFCCTNGGAKQLGQIMRYQPQSSQPQGSQQQGATADSASNSETSGGRLQLFVESDDANLYNFGDNLTVSPNGHLIVCEDQYTEIVDNHLRGVTPEGDIYNVAKLHAQTELAGACFTNDGSVLFVNMYSPSKTLAITGPWMAL